METSQLVENDSRKKKSNKALVFLSLAIFFDYLSLYALKVKLSYLLIDGYHLPVSKAETYKAELYIFLFIFAGISGIFSDFPLNRLLLVILSYVCSFFGIIGLMLLEFNSYQKYLIPVLCKYKDDTFPPKCELLLYLITLLISCGTGFVRVLLFVIATDQVRTCGARTVSMCLFSLFGVSQLAAIVVDVIGLQVNNFTMILIIIIIVLILSFALFVTGEKRFLLNLGFAVIETKKGGRFYVSGRLFAEWRVQKDFMKNYFTATKELYKSWRLRKSATYLVLNTKLRLQNTDLDDSLEAIKRFAYLFVLWWLLIPCCVVLSQFEINDVQIRLFRAPEINSRFSDEFIIYVSVVITVLLFNCLSWKYLQLDEVFSYKWRFISATVLGILAAGYSGLIETYRQDLFWNKNDTVLVNSTYPSNGTYLITNISVFFLAPSYIMTGVGETILLCTGLEFAYLSMPPNLQCSAVGLIWTCWAMGSFISSVFFSKFDGVLFDKLDPNRLNHAHGHLDYFYYILSSFSLICFLILLPIVIKFLPSLFNPCYLGLEARLLGEDVDQPREDDSEWEEDNDSASFRPRYYSQRSSTQQIST